MPIYRNSITLYHEDEDIVLHVFDYSPTSENCEVVKDRQMISVSSCITVGTQSLDAVKRLTKSVLKPGVVFEGYYIKTAGQYDYCYKLWTKRHLPFAPLSDRSPKEDQPLRSILLDVNGDYAGLACGQHLAFCKLKELDEIDFDYTVKLPAPGPKVYLKFVKEKRASEIPYAAYEANPARKTETVASDEETLISQGCKDTEKEKVEEEEKAKVEEAEVKVEVEEEQEPEQ